MTQLQLREASQAETKLRYRATRRVLQWSKRHAPTIGILIALPLAVGFKAAYSYRIDHEAVVPAQRIQTSGLHTRELALVKTVYLDHQTGAAIYRDREVMDQLRHIQIGKPTSASAAKLKAIDAVWLSNVKDQGAIVALVGTALTANAVNTLISDLQTTGYFKNIEIRETYQDEKKNSPVFQFELICEFQEART